MLNYNFSSKNNNAVDVVRLQLEDACQTLEGLGQLTHFILRRRVRGSWVIVRSVFSVRTAHPTEIYPCKRLHHG